MSLALLFPGQGTQHPEMLPWIDTQPECAATLQRLGLALGPDWRLRLTDPTWSSRNTVAQSLLTGLGIAAWQCLAPRLPAPAAIAGYSVGELPAFWAAGVFDAATALQLADARARAMERSVQGLITGLLAVQGLPLKQILANGERVGLALAIRLGADRAVLGGLDSALDGAEAEFGAAGARCTRLAVRLASHTPWVASAAEDFGAQLTELVFWPPTTTLVCNLGGAALREPEALRQALAGQIASPVLWDSCMDALAERRVACVLEIGPGSTLARLWNGRHPAIPARSIDEFRSPAAVAQWVAATLAAGRGA